MTTFARFAANPGGGALGAAPDEKEKGSAYVQLKALLVNCRFRAGEQLQIADLAKRLALSNTPVREALIRLHAEGFLVLQPHRGFFAKAPSVREAMQLYEFGYALLRHAVRKHLNVAHVAPSLGFDTLIDQVAGIGNGSEHNAPFLATRVEQVLEELMSLTQNDVMMASFHNFHERTHYLRVLQLQRPKQFPKRVGELRRLIETIRKRDADALAVLDNHWKSKIELLPDMVKEAISRPYV